MTGQRHPILFPLLFAALLGAITLILGEVALRTFFERALGRPPADAERSAEHNFRLLVREGLLDGYLDLTELHLQEGIRPGDVQCPYDEHFCERGTQWLARTQGAGASRRQAVTPPTCRSSVGRVRTLLHMVAAGGR